MHRPICAFVFGNIQRLHSDVPVLVAVDRLNVFELRDVGLGVTGGRGQTVQHGACA